MKFESKKGKMVYAKGEIIEFKDGKYETEDKEVIEILKSLKDVKAIDGRKKQE